MLNKASVHIGVNLSEVLLDNKCQLSALPNSLLGELSRSIRDKINVVYPDQYSHQSLDDVQSAITVGAEGVVVGEGKGRGYEPSEHDTYIDNYIDELGTLLNNYLNFARNTVNKEVNKLSEAVSQSVNNYRHREAEDFFNVTYYSLPDLFSSETVVESISKYEGSVHLLKRGFEKMNTSSVVDVEDVCSLICIGNEDEDVHVRSFGATRKSDIIRYLNDNVEEYRLSVVQLLDYYLVNYLFYRNLSNGMDFNTSEGLGSVRNKSAINRDYFGAALFNQLSIYRNNITSGVLLAAPIGKFSYFNDSTMDVVVYEESFAKLAEEGHGIETLFGYIASTNNDGLMSVRVADIMKSAGTYLTNWNRTRSLYLIHLNNKRIDIFKHLLVVEFDQSIASRDVMTEAEQEFVDKDPAFVEHTRKLAYAYIDSLTVDDIECLDQVALTLVAKYRFRFSNAFDLLNRMSELLQADEKLDPMTAALLSACDYMVEYCLAQTQVVKV